MFCISFICTKRRVEKNDNWPLNSGPTVPDYFLAGPSYFLESEQIPSENVCCHFYSFCDCCTDMTVESIFSYNSRQERKKLVYFPKCPTFSYKADRQMINNLSRCILPYFVAADKLNFWLRGVSVFPREGSSAHNIRNTEALSKL